MIDRQSDEVTSVEQLVLQDEEWTWAKNKTKR